MQYDFDIPGNGGMDITAIGQYVKYKSGLGAVRIRMSSGGYVDLIPGQGFKVKTEFASINVSDRSGNANKGTVLIGDYEFQDDTINGVVTIVDGAKQNTLAKNCFLGTVNSGAVAANFNMACLINPTGSVKNVVVEAINVSGPTATIVSMHMLSISQSLAVHAQNKYAAIVGGVPSIAFIEPQNTNTFGALGLPFSSGQLSVNAPIVRRYAEPLIIPPGMAVLVVNNNVAQAIFVDFEFREDPL